jgi:hypothetical protein
MTDIGPTGKFPMGKICENDEGELAIGVTTEGNRVVVKFCTPITWFAVYPDQAIKMAEVLLKKARELSN